MKGKLYVIKASGEISETMLTEAPKLESLQKAVGGYIEVVPFFVHFQGLDCIALCNEEGKLIGLPINGSATEAWRNQCGGWINDVLVGSVVIICGDAELLSEL